METLRKNQKEMSNTKYYDRNEECLNGLSSRLDMNEKRISDLVDVSIAPQKLKVKRIKTEKKLLSSKDWGQLQKVYYTHNENMRGRRKKGIEDIFEMIIWKL